MKMIEITTTDRQALRALLDRPLTELMGSLNVDTINELSHLYHRIDTAVRDPADESSPAYEHAG